MSAGGSPRPPARSDRRRPPPPRSGPPAHISALARRVIELLCEVEAGLRSPRQLRELLTPEVYADFERAGGRRGPAPRVRALMVVRTNDRCYEAVATLSQGSRVTAVGLQLSRQGRWWWVTDLVRPEPHAWCTPELSNPAMPGR